MPVPTPASHLTSGQSFVDISNFNRILSFQTGTVLAASALGALMKKGAPMRFATMQDPSETWLVYDLISDLPAEIAGRPLIGLTRNEAEHLSAKANAAGEWLSNRQKWPQGQTGLAV